MHHAILAPVVTLVGWTLVMLVWVLAVRLPALRRAGVDLSKARGGRPGLLDTLLDEKAQWPAHNYMHLVEQPTLFYAITAVLALLGAEGPAAVALAWIYVALRIAHSVVQATVNRILFRFTLFIASSVVLMLLTLTAALALFRAG